MPRSARIVIPNHPHHVIQRGNNQQNVFEIKEDYENYCYWINQYAKRFEVDVIAYCLMTNHVHFVVVPRNSDALANMFSNVHMRYTQFWNYKHKVSGHLWQGRFYSCPMDKRHAVSCLRYVEQNPVRAKMVKNPWDYPWSSARWHIGMANRRYVFINDSDVFKYGRRRWRKFLLDNDIKANDLIREYTHKGFAIAGESFIDKWEKKLSAKLRPGKPGRPKKCGSLKF